MNITRNGKIARLPKTVRDELNQRLANGERGTELVAWLNSLPEVQCIITEQFGGRPMRAQNLSEWKHGGYKDWNNKQEAMELARQLPAEAAALKSATGELPSDILATWLTAHYAVAAHQLKDTGALGLKQFGKLIRDVSVLRRGDHSAERLKLEKAKLEHARKQTEDEMIAQFVRWARDPKVRELIRKYINSEEAEEVSQKVNEPVGQKSCAPGALVQSSGRLRKLCNPRISPSSLPSLRVSDPFPDHDPDVGRPF